MNAKVYEVLDNARDMVMLNTKMIDINDSLATIEMRVADAVNAFHSYVDCIEYFRQYGELSEAQAYHLTKEAYRWFKKE